MVDPIAWISLQKFVDIHVANVSSADLSPINTIIAPSAIPRTTSPITQKIPSIVSLWVVIMFIKSWVPVDILSKSPPLMTSPVKETPTISLASPMKVSLSVESLPSSVWLCLSIAPAIPGICHIFLMYSPRASDVFSTSTVSPRNVIATLFVPLIAAAFIQNSFRRSNSPVIASLYASTA